MTIPLAVNILLLSLVFTLAFGIALILRKTILCKNAKTMCIVWIFVLFSAIVPVFSSFSIFPSLIKEQIISKTSSFIIPESDILSRAANDLQSIRNTEEPYTYPSEGLSEENSENEKPYLTVKIISAAAVLIWSTGVIYSLTRDISRDFSVKRALYNNSIVCSNAYTQQAFNNCCAKLKLKKQIELRIVCSNFFFSPCVIGYFHPCVFISEECAKYDENRMTFIFLHELSHVKRRDAVLRLFALIVTSVHWFNPVSCYVYRFITEDCEFSCDKQVLSIIGNNSIGSYMSTILDIAEHLCPDISNTEKQMVGFLFIRPSSGRRFLERRYANMKSIVKNKYSIPLTALFIVVIITINTIIMSSCGISLLHTNAEDSKPAEAEVNPLLDEAIRMYYEVLPDAEITDEMKAGIKTLNVRAVNIVTEPSSDGYGTILINFIINGTEIPILPRITEANLFEVKYLNVLEEYYNNDSDISRLMNFMAFYRKENYFDTSVEPRQREELLQIYPNITNYPDGLYILDPEIQPREENKLILILNEAGLLEANKTDGVFDASCLISLPNLSEVVYSGVTVVNEAIPSGCTSIYEDNLSN